MKRLTVFLTVFFTIAVYAVSVCGEEQTINTQNLPAWVLEAGLPVIPDVMGEVAVLEMDQGVYKRRDFNTDSMSVFPGWPVNQTGGTFEGGIMVNMDNDDALEIVYTIGYSIYAWNYDGTPVPGWPQTINYAFQGAPAYGDIDGDGDPEIVAGSIWTMTSGRICAYELNGSTVEGFPIEHGYASRTIVLADIDDNGDLEIITNKRMWPIGEWYVYDGDGSLYPGWPVDIESVPSSSSSVGDVTGDGIPEITGQSYQALHVWDVNGNPMPGFPFFFTNGAVSSYSSTVIADLDEDGLNEFIVGTHVLGGGGYVYVLNGDGTSVPGWPKATNYWIYGPPAVGDINGDGHLDVAVGDQVLSGTPVDRLYAWDRFGNNLPGFPITNLPAINNQVMLADFDNDGAIELVTDDNTTYGGTCGKYHGYNHDGTLLAGWPLSINGGTTMFHMPVIGDVDNDGVMDFSGSCGITSSTVYLASVNVPFDASSAIIPVWQYNVRHDGLYYEEFIAPELAVTLTPAITPVIIPAGGGSFDYTLDITNLGTGAGTFDGWVEAVLPSGSVYGPLLLRNNVTLGAGMSLSREMSQTIPGSAPAGTYTYRLNTGNYPGTVVASDEFDFEKTAAGDGGFVTGWEISGFDGESTVEIQLPNSGLLLSAYPNPFNNQAVFSFELGTAGMTELTVFDVTGREAASLVNGHLSSGQHQVVWDAAGFTSGVYFVHLTVERGRLMEMRKVLLVK